MRRIFQSPLWDVLSTLASRLEARPRGGGPLEPGALLPERAKVPEAHGPPAGKSALHWAQFFGIEARVSFSELLKRTGRQIQADNCINLAAQMSYFFVLSLFPFLLFLAAVIGYLPFTDLWSKVLTWITQYFPRDYQRLVLDTVLGLTKGRTRFLSAGLLTTIWVASSGILSLIESLDAAYAVKETRGFWKLRGIALIMLFVLSFCFLSAFGLVTIGDRLGYWIVARANPELSLLWAVARWGLSLILLLIGSALIYYTLPNIKQSWRWVLPGSLFIALVWVPASIGFSYYVQHFAAYDKTYGSLGVFIGFMVWIYIVSLIILVGAELNSELEKSSPQVGIRQDNP